MTDEHVIEVIGKCRVLIRDGEVAEVQKPVITECPLAKRFAYPIEKITEETVKQNIEHRIRSFGMSPSERNHFSDDDFVGFGASELIGTAIQK